MGFPDDDRYQVVHQVSEDCLQYQDRTDDRVMMHLVMRSGRSNKSKQAFYKKMVKNLSIKPVTADFSPGARLLQNKPLCHRSSFFGPLSGYFAFSFA